MVESTCQRIARPVRRWRRTRGWGATLAVASVACLFVASAFPVTASARAVPSALEHVAAGGTHWSGWHVEPPVGFVIWAAWPHVWCEPADEAWHAGNVAIHCAAFDLGTGLVDPADASFTLSTSVPDGVANADASTGTRLICNAAGNCRTAGPVSGIRVDRTAPEIRATVDPPAGPYAPGAKVQVTFTCTDTASGIGSCPSSAILDTTSTGIYSVSFGTADGVGNLTSVGVHYTVQSAGMAPMMVLPDPRGELI